MIPPTLILVVLVAFAGLLASNAYTGWAWLQARDKAATLQERIDNTVDVARECSRGVDALQALNTAVRGSPNSDHLTGHAADFVAPAWGDPLKICRLLLAHNDQLKWDQLIFEVGWVHISFNVRRRNQVLTAHFTPSGVRYTQGLA